MEKLLWFVKVIGFNFSLGFFIDDKGERYNFDYFLGNIFKLFNEVFEDE